LLHLQHQSDGWWLSVDSQMIISAARPIQSPGVAVQAWFVTFLCLEFEYPQRLQNACLFIEKALLGEHGKIR